MAGRQSRNRLPQLRRQPDQDRDPRPAAQDSEKKHFWDLNFGKRPREEFYNLAVRSRLHDQPRAGPGLPADQREMRSLMIAELTAQKDPRMRGEGHLFDEHPYADESSRGFYERYLRGETVNSGWVEPTDFEPEPIE